MSIEKSIFYSKFVMKEYKIASFLRRRKKFFLNRYFKFTISFEFLKLKMKKI